MADVDRAGASRGDVGAAILARAGPRGTRRRDGVDARDARERTPPPTATAAVATTTAARGEMFGADLARISPVPASRKRSTRNAIAADKAAKAKTPAKNAPGTTPEERTFYTRLAKADPMHEMISSQDNPSYPPGDLVKRLRSHSDEGVSTVLLPLGDGFTLFTARRRV